MIIIMIIIIIIIIIVILKIKIKNKLKQLVIKLFFISAIRYGYCYFLNFTKI